MERLTERDWRRGVGGGRLIEKDLRGRWDLPKRRQQTACSAAGGGGRLTQEGEARLLQNKMTTSNLW